MDRLTAALRARLPIINVTTTDTLNVVRVLTYLTKQKVAVRMQISGSDIASVTTKYVVASGFSAGVEDIYRALKHHDKCMILVNTEQESPLIYVGGELPTPREMVVVALDEHLMGESEDFLPLVGGLTLKDLDDLIEMTLARDGDLTPRGVAESRRLYAPQLRGIEPVDTNLTFYLINEHIERWLDLNKPFFLSTDEDERLIPRGLLLDGAPGVGKTMAAKYIAGELGVPLYRLDLSSMMSKWLGDAERNLKRALTQIEQEEPCVVLIDEVEKAFNKSGGGEHETTGRVLGYLLWWLQERTARVLMVMTTNNKESLPMELFRPGRVDQYFTLEKLLGHEIKEMVDELLSTFTLDPTVRVKTMQILEKQVGIILSSSPGNPSGMSRSHAQITQMVYEAIKEAAREHI